MTQILQAEVPAQAAPVENTGDWISFWTYFSEIFVPEMGIDLPLKQAHRDACEAIEAAFFGELEPNIDPITAEIFYILYVLICLPRRVGKTKIIEAFYTYAFGYVPDCQFIHTSYSTLLTEPSMAYVAKVMQMGWYREWFGSLLHGIRGDHISTVDGGNLYAAGTGGTLTGKGGGLKRPGGGAIVIDDPAKPDEVLSPVVSKGIIQWFETTIKGCRNSDRFCPIIIVQQRLGKNDLAAYVRDTYPKQTRMIKFPALVDPDTGKASTQDNAVSAFPETRSAQELLSLRATRIGRFVLATQWQQEDATLGGNMIPIECFGRWDPDQFGSMKWIRFFITVDTALKTKEANDYSCAQLWGGYEKSAYLIDEIHGKWESPDLLDRLESFWEKWGHIPNMPRPRMVIEEKAAGTPTLQHLKKKGIPAQGIERDIDKVRRVQNVLPFIETGRVLIPKPGSRPWIEGWEEEHSQFTALMNHAHDDRVECAADGIEMLLGRKLSSFDVLLDRR